MSDTTAKQVGTSRSSDYMNPNAALAVVIGVVLIFMSVAIVVFGVERNDRGLVEKVDSQLTAERTKFVEENSQVTVLDVSFDGGWGKKYVWVEGEDGSRARIKNPILNPNSHFLPEKNGDMLSAGDVCETYLYDVSKGRRKGIGLRRVVDREVN